MLEVTGPTSPRNDILVTRFGGSEWQSAQNAFVGPLEILRSVSFVLKNDSDKAIMAIAITWEVTTGNGTKRMNKYLCDGYLLAEPRPTVPPHSRVLVAPYQVLREGALTTAGLKSDDFSDATRIAIAIDSIVFEDGRVVGPNKLLFDDVIRSRKQAAKEVLSIVRAARTRGESPSEALSAMANAVPLKSDGTTIWKRRFAHQLLKTKNFNGVLEYLDRLPTPPEFARE